MILYYISSSKQKKELIESDYAEDLYDTLIDFFEEHRFYPHFLELTADGEIAKIKFESASEVFLVEDFDEESLGELEDLINDYQR